MILEDIEQNLKMESGYMDHQCLMVRFIAFIVVRYAVYDVISSTVGQWTGSYDKNGTKVYEGDIIRDGNRLFVVVFEAPQFCAKEIDKNIFYLLSLKEDMEVVGNIYDDVWMMDLN